MAINKVFLWKIYGSFCQDKKWLSLRGDCKGQRGEEGRGVEGTVDGIKVHLTPKLFFGQDETLQHSHREFDNIISIWYA